jgi:hypothetical protein
LRVKRPGLLQIRVAAKIRKEGRILREKRCKDGSPLIAFLLSFPKHLSVERGKGLNFFYGNGPCGTYLDTTLATQAFIHIYRLGFAFLDLEYVGRTSIYALSFSVTFVFIDCYLIHGCSYSPPLP